MDRGLDYRMHPAPRTYIEKKYCRQVKVCSTEQDNTVAVILLAHVDRAGQLIRENGVKAGRSGDCRP